MSTFYYENIVVNLPYSCIFILIGYPINVRKRDLPKCILLLCSHLIQIKDNVSVGCENVYSNGEWLHALHAQHFQAAIIQLII